MRTLSYFVVLQSACLSALPATDRLEGAATSIKNPPASPADVVPTDAPTNDSPTNDSPTNGAPTSPPASASPILHAPAAAIVARAIADSLVQYMRGGAYTNMGNSGGGSIILALASYAGDTTADARLLVQMRYTLEGANTICANGGYPAQHELLVTGMYTIAKNTPRIWSQLSGAEKSAVDALMEASLIAGAFTTSDANPFTDAGTQQYTLDGDSNVNRDWNPNYREGMVGSVTTAAAYFGVDATVAMLAAYKHSDFVTMLKAAGLTNSYDTFTWKAANPSSAAPSPTQIETAVHAYAYHGHKIDALMAFHQYMADFTFGANVACGLNGGKGIDVAGTYSGVIIAGCASLPNLGMPGMIAEFNSADAEGQRSSSPYAYGAYKGDIITHAAMVTAGVWQSGAIADEILGRVKIGSTDLWYKLDQSYEDYAHATDDGTRSFTDSGWGFAYFRSVWQDVLSPYQVTN